MKRKNESTRHVGQFTICNSWISHCERSQIYLFEDSLKPLASGYYSRVNRTRQRYDYETSFIHAVNNLVDSIPSWTRYEQLKPSIDELYKAIGTMHTYGGTPRD